MTDMGMMKSKYPELFFLDDLIQPDWTSIDIGSNLGYYSNRIAKKMNTGKLYAVEPIPLFVDVWKTNIDHRSPNITLFNLALGSENKEVTMSIPTKNGVIRHGLTKIDEQEQEDEGIEKAYTYSVQMKRSEEVFQSIDKIDFIKIDVEGYEQFVLSSMENILSEKLPIIQAELGGDENRKNSYALLKSMGYELYFLKDQSLTKLSEKNFYSLSQDIYFIHPDKKKKIEHLFEV